MVKLESIATFFSDKTSLKAVTSVSIAETELPRFVMFRTVRKPRITVSSCTDKLEPKIAKTATDTWPSEQALPPLYISLKNVNSDEDKAPPSCANVRTETILPNETDL
jgi:hypothetical protein